jgi:hypothetical protein
MTNISNTTRRYKMVRHILVFLTLSFFTGCAWLIHGSKQSIDIQSNPPNAKIFVDYQYKANTPYTIRLLRSDYHHIKIELDGYLPFETDITRTIDGWFWANLLVCLPGLAIDYFTGSLYRLTPSQIQAELKSKSTSSRGDSNNLFICVVLSADTSWNKIGTLNRIQ